MKGDISLMRMEKSFGSDPCIWMENLVNVEISMTIPPVLHWAIHILVKSCYGLNATANMRPCHHCFSGSAGIL